jgi:hypothetical protein
MSSNEDRMSSCARHSTLRIVNDLGLVPDRWGAIVRHAAFSARRFWLSWMGGSPLLTAFRRQSSEPRPGTEWVVSQRVTVEVRMSDMLKGHRPDSAQLPGASTAERYSRAAATRVAARVESSGVDRTRIITG